MFNFFKKQENLFTLLEPESRKYFEQNLLWLNQEFPEPPLEKRKIFTPTEVDFPIKSNNSEENAREVLKIACENMQIDLETVDLEFFENGIKELNVGLSPIFMENDPELIVPAGIYFDKNPDGKFMIAIDKGNLNTPEILVAIISHELAHLKLLGEKRLQENDEYLTDLATVFFGFGIFNANMCFHFYQETDRWGYSNLGYLKQEEWAYSLALYAYLRYEDKPEWSCFLNKSIKKDFERSLEYILNNENEIFQFANVPE